MHFHKLSIRKKAKTFQIAIQVSLKKLLAAPFPTDGLFEIPAQCFDRYFLGNVGGIHSSALFICSLHWSICDVSCAALL